MIDNEFNELSELTRDNPIRKIVLYKSTAYPMVYEVGRMYGTGRLRISSIESTTSKLGDRNFFIFVNKRGDNGDFDTVEYLWKTESSPEVSTEFDLDFDVIDL